MNEEILARLLANLDSVEARAASFITDPQGLAKAAKTMATVRQSVIDAVRNAPGPLPADYQLPGVSYVCQRLDEARERVLALKIPEKAATPPAIEKLRGTPAPAPLAVPTPVPERESLAQWHAKFDWTTFGKKAPATAAAGDSRLQPAGPDVADWAISVAGVSESSLSEPDPNRKRSATELFNEEVSAPNTEPPPPPSKHKHFDSWLGES